LMPL